MTTTATGEYTLEVVAGTYYVWTSNALHYVNQTYGGRRCAGSCVDPGQPLALAAAEHAVVDFAMDPGGTIGGRVLDAVTGAALPALVTLYDAKRQFVLNTPNDGSGSFLINGGADGGLPTGTYFLGVLTPPNGGYVAELYNNVACVPLCRVADATPVRVVSRQATGGIVIALQTGGAIAGRVTDAVTGQHLAGVQVGATGIEVGSVSHFSRTSESDSTGFYRIEGLQPGTYNVFTDRAPGYVDTVFPDGPLVCTGPFCTREVRAGAPVSVGAGQLVNGIDFRLRRTGSITGHVTEAGTGAPGAGLVQVVTASGVSGGFASPANDGSYVLEGLPPGRYFLRAFVTRMGLPSGRVYDGFPCTVFDCSAVAGTPVTVVEGAVTTGIDFSLPAFNASISGTIRSTATGGLLDATIESVLGRHGDRDPVRVVVYVPGSGGGNVPRQSLGSRPHRRVVRQRVRSVRRQGDRRHCCQRNEPDGNRFQPSGRVEDYRPGHEGAAESATSPSRRCAPMAPWCGAVFLESDSAYTIDGLPAGHLRRPRHRQSAELSEGRTVWRLASRRAVRRRPLRWQRLPADGRNTGDRRRGRARHPGSTSSSTGPRRSGAACTQKATRSRPLHVGSVGGGPGVHRRWAHGWTLCRPDWWAVPDLWPPWRHVLLEDRRCDGLGLRRPDLQGPGLSRLLADQRESGHGRGRRDPDRHRFHAVARRHRQGIRARQRERGAARQRDGDGVHRRGPEGGVRRLRLPWELHHRRSRRRVVFPRHVQHAGLRRRGLRRCGVRDVRPVARASGVTSPGGQTTSRNRLRADTRSAPLRPRRGHQRQPARRRAGVNLRCRGHARGSRRQH